MIRQHLGNDEQAGSIGTLLLRLVSGVFNLQDH